MASDVKTWAEATRPGQDPATIALRECVMDMVMLVNAMHRIAGNQPFTPAMLEAALAHTQDLRASLEALRTHAKA